MNVRTDSQTHSARALRWRLTALSLALLALLAMAALGAAWGSVPIPVQAV